MGGGSGGSGGSDGGPIRPGALRIEGRNPWERESGEEEHQQQQQQDTNSRNEENRQGPKVSASSASHSNINNINNNSIDEEALFLSEAHLVQDVAVIVADVVTRDDLISEVRDQVLGEAMKDNNNDIMVRRRSDIDRERQNNYHKVVIMAATFFCGCGCFLLVVIAAVTIGLVFGDSNTNNNTNNNDDSSTTMPTGGGGGNEPPSLERLQFLRDTLLPLLSEYGGDKLADATKEKINDNDKNKKNPQNRAFLNLANDPNLMTEYSPRRLLRRFALTSFYYAANGEEWTVQTDWLSYDVHECHWYGIITTTSTTPTMGCETLPDDESNFGLQLPENNLQGRVFAHIAYLAEHLVSIDLKGNRLVGFPLLVALGLPKLETLYLNDNQLQGNLQEDLGGGRGCAQTDTCEVAFSDSVLRELDLGNNNYSGGLPRAFASLGQLLVLRVDRNSELSGRIPQPFCSMGLLQELSVLDTSIDGQMPPCFCRRQNFLGEADCTNTTTTTTTTSEAFTCTCCDCCGCGGGG
jgi:hypothetical protein